MDLKEKHPKKINKKPLMIQQNNDESKDPLSFKGALCNVQLIRLQEKHIAS